MSGRVLSGNSATYYPQADSKRQVLDIKETLDKFEEMVQREDFPIATLKIEGEDARPLTKELAQALLQVANALTQGKAVFVAPCDMMLTTQDAADMLGMSRPTFVKLLESGEIPFTKVGRHRRVRLDDLQTYDNQRHASFMQSMAELNRDTDPSLTAHNPLIKG
ncbi:MerR family transcriptional regulator [Bifidobacterium lemurum]|uniref:MerR family transcriptional regulator n=1 Tax=Bifidobacterium lemurum TaxID=1603886 RepID=A0A261FRI0_9BIFI|nr:helix-turn-helix domain-containing protein [Bifidobacterium lemurum]OZG61791.1 MerR family transcriptional regulator [Bifidobacterium lemurum]QOL34943.1 helix-turn-helix domain-containing protein [Bifidobacterium lemurum]